MQDNILPTQIVILGGSGDLSKHKLLPALLHLFGKKRMPEQFNIIGLARTPRTDDEYRDFVTQAITTEHGHDHSKESIKDFCSHISYVAGNFDTTESYLDLKNKIDTFEIERGEATNKLFYLAVPPEYYKEIFQNLHDTKLVSKCTGETGWERILVEKPFGDNLQTAVELEEQLSSLFREEQIFRIDHYLAKEAVQNILSFRFANTLFKDTWNNTSIKEVRIMMHEAVDVGTRGNFYDGIGALRDVGQNHLLQLLALVAMDEPSNFDVDEIRSKRASILKKLEHIKDISKQVVRAQYEGYQDTTGVKINSGTETYFAIQTYIDVPAWKNVPFFISAGKGLDEKKVTIEIIYKDIATGLFETESCHSTENKITLYIAPNQSTHIEFNAKAPGLGYQLHQRELSFDCSSEDEIKNSYEKVLLDCIAGDQTLFASTEEVFASWDFITPILKNWGKVPLQIYTKGSKGPQNGIQ